MLQSQNAKGKISRSVGKSSEDIQYKFIIVLRIWRWNFLKDMAPKWDVLIMIF